MHVKGKGSSVLKSIQRMYNALVLGAIVTVSRSIVITFFYCASTVRKGSGSAREEDKKSLVFF